jgi:Na+/H+-dicarboxylate symporter
VAAGAVVLNASSPGIPSGGLLIQAPLYAAVGLPVEGLGILIAVDTVPDSFKTPFNVTADLAVAAVLNRHHPTEAAAPNA